MLQKGDVVRWSTKNKLIILMRNYDPNSLGVVIKVKEKIEDGKTIQVLDIKWIKSGNTQHNLRDWSLEKVGTVQD